MRPSDAPSGTAQRTVLAGTAVLLVLVGVVALAYLGNGRRGPAAAVDSSGDSLAAAPPARDTVRSPAETAQDRQAERPRITPPRVRDSAPVIRFPPDSSPPPTVQDLPVAEAIRDPATRDAARRQAEQIYARHDATPEVRAEAAFTVARVHYEEKRWTEARSWAEQALEVNARSEQGPDRLRRAETYRTFLERLPPNPGLERT